MMFQKPYVYWEYGTRGEDRRTPSSAAKCSGVWHPSVVSESLRYQTDSGLIPMSLIWYHHPLDDISYLRYQIDSDLISLSLIWYHRPLDDISYLRYQIDSDLISLSLIWYHPSMISEIHRFRLSYVFGLIPSFKVSERSSASDWLRSGTDASDLVSSSFGWHQSQ